MGKLSFAAAAAFLAFAVSSAPAEASIIDGTWSGSGSGAVAQGLILPGDPLPPDPVSFSATFSFDNATTQNYVAISDFTTNFGATSANFNYVPANDILSLYFNSAAGEISLSFNSVSTDPTNPTGLGWLSNSSRTSAYYTTENGSFTPASAAVPEPASLLLLATGLIALGFATRQRCIRAV